jgi:hypothetical protein
MLGAGEYPPVSFVFSHSAVGAAGKKSEPLNGLKDTGVGKMLCTGTGAGVHGAGVIVTRGLPPTTVRCAYEDALIASNRALAAAKPK